MTKKCSSCGVVKPRIEFYKNKQRYDGLQNNCIPCSKIAARVNRAKNPDIGKPKTITTKAQRLEYQREYQRKRRASIPKKPRVNAVSTDKYYLKYLEADRKLLTHSQLYRKILMMMPVTC